MSPPATSIAKSSPPLRVDALVKRFGEMTALDGITLEVHGGECLGLLGPNGAGKSTLIRSIVGRVIPDAGTISVFGARKSDFETRYRLGKAHRIIVHTHGSQPLAWRKATHLLFVDQFGELFGELFAPEVFVRLVTSPFCDFLEL